MGLRIKGIWLIGGFKGCTMWEFQIGPFFFTWCHLNGTYWRWKPWRRINFGYDEEWLYE